jgi:hypothetical protein
MEHPSRSLFLAAGLLLLSLPVVADVRKFVAKCPNGRMIEVVLKTGERVKGRLGSRLSDGFVVESETSLHTERMLRFDEVRSVKSRPVDQSSTKSSGIRKWQFGLIYCLAAVALIPWIRTQR